MGGEKAMVQAPIGYKLKGNLAFVSPNIKT